MTPEHARFAWNRFRQTMPPTALPPATDDVRAFHRSLPGYAPTPLVPRPALAAELGLGAVWLNTEGATDPASYREIVGADPQ